jgi:hypothetical protein
VIRDILTGSDEPSKEIKEAILTSLIEKEIHELMTGLTIVTQTKEVH